MHCRGPMWRYASALTLFLSCALAAAQKSVLILHDGSPQMPYHILVSSEMQSDLTSPQFNIQIFDEYLESWRLGRDSARFVRALQAKYTGRKFDVVVADGHESLSLLVSQRLPFLADTPVVFLAVPDFYLPPNLPANVTGFVVHRDYAETARLAMTLQPGLRHLYHLESEPATDPKIDIVRKQLAPLSSKIDLVTWSGLAADEILRRVKSLPPDSAVLFDSYLTDFDGNAYISAYFCSRIAEHANAPVYTASHTSIGNGPVGGVVVDAEEVARQTARTVLGLLAGAPISQYPVRVAPMNIIVDWRRVEQLGLSGDNLPSSATFLFRPPSLLQRYRGYLIAGAVIFLLQTILTIELALAVRQRKKSEQSARELASRLINAQEEERRRIAAELHDDVSQRLALVAVHLDTMRGSLSPSNSDLIGELSALYDKADLISSDIHHFSHELHPANLERLGLGLALHRYCLEFAAHRKIAIDFTATGVEPPMSPDIALAFFRIGQECLMNAAKHSGASHCRVSLICARNRISLSVEDNGKGFDPKSAQAQAGLGIRSMRERLRSIGGRLRIQSSPRHGTTIFAEAQLAHSPGAPPETSDS